MDIYFRKKIEKPKCEQSLIVPPVGHPQSSQLNFRHLMAYLLNCVSSEDFLMIHARDDFSCIQGTTPYTHSSPGTPINMPWLGSMQTGRGASVVRVLNIRIE